MGTISRLLFLSGLFSLIFSVSGVQGQKSGVIVKHPVKISAAPHEYLGGGQLTECVPQPGTDQRLDAQGTYAPEGNYRWMASPAMDADGNIGTGYSFGGPGDHPGQRFAGRLRGDPPGIRTLKEAVLVNGEAPQLRKRRCEDYTQTAVDPSNDRTIWYVGDYLKTDSRDYSARIGAFRLMGK